MDFRKVHDTIPEEFEKWRPRYCNWLSCGNVVNYGFSAPERRDYHATVTCNADEYVSYIATHCDHIVLPGPYKAKLYQVQGK
ncbi:MAG: hypothetical protein JW874_06120 [Spirochaetales bacterium]|nr:hypothetical protein [Spirochaetales bacterium]